MRGKWIICFFLVLFICSLGFAQEAPKKAKIERTPLLTVTGRIISKGGDIVLITSEAKGYLLEKTETLEKAFDKVKELVNKDVDVTLSGFDTGETKGFRFIDHKAKKARETNYRILRVALITKAEQGSKVTNLDISKPVDYQSLPKEVISPLRVIKGKIIKCDFKNLIPTIELEGKPGFAVMVPPNIETTKVVGGKLVAFKPKDVLKEGMKVEIWYEEKGDLNTARMIAIQEKDILNQQK
jgi:hypothetical protein